jgi:ABC-type sugar transport system ATPase subunit
MAVADGNVLPLHEIERSLASVHARREASVSATPDKVVSICGENRAGKSTMKNIDGGLLPPGAQAIKRGVKMLLRFKISDFKAFGIGVIHRELILFKRALGGRYRLL